MGENPGLDIVYAITVMIQVQKRFICRTLSVRRCVFFLSVSVRQFDSVIKATIDPVKDDCDADG